MWPWSECFKLCLPAAGCGMLKCLLRWRKSCNPDNNNNKKSSCSLPLFLGLLDYGKDRMLWWRTESHSVDLNSEAKPNMAVDRKSTTQILVCCLEEECVGFSLWVLLLFWLIGFWGKGVFFVVVFGFGGIFAFVVWFGGFVLWLGLVGCIFKALVQFFSFPFLPLPFSAVPWNVVYVSVWSMWGVRELPLVRRWSAVKSLCVTAKTLPECLDIWAFPCWTFTYLFCMTKYWAGATNYCWG